MSTYREADAENAPQWSPGEHEQLVGNGRGAWPQGGPTIVGYVAGSDGTPLEGATVTLTDPQGRQLDHGWTSPQGAYQLTPPTGGTYIVICAFGSYQPNAALIPVAERSVRHDVRLAGASSVYGVVRAAKSTQGISGVIVTLIDVRGAVSGVTTTDSEGRFELRGVAEGNYTLAVATDGFQPTASTVVLPLGGRVRHDVELASRGRLAGKVHAATSGRAVDEAVVTLLDPVGNVLSTQVTGADGGYAFEDLAEGEYTLTASGYAPVALSTQVTAGESVVRDIALGVSAHDD